MKTESKYLRSLLFIPAGKLDKWKKATATGADIICIDLEDSVPPPEKEAARASVFSFLEKNAEIHPCVLIRINRPGTEHGNRDVDMIRELKKPPQGIMVPKLDEPGPLDVLAKQLIMFGKKTDLYPLIETAEGLENTRKLCSSNLVAGAVFGGHDLAMQLGCSKEWDVLAAYRSEFIRGAGGLGIALFDMPWFGLTDPEGLKAEAANAKRFGFTGKTAIHPGQITPIHSVFTPTAAEVTEAAEKIQRFEQNGEHATVWKDTILEPPVIEQAKTLIERAKFLDRIPSK